ncbi:MAG: molybdopterin biosynthesis protein [Gemmatales bacterium]|nr:molybdopterin biosynthesis protein [Gemmatales bacterium]MDW8385393.1 molybdopterin biosynthesis protein [Gemmatales bacterium]
MTAQQDQFLNVIDRDEAERRFRQAVPLQPLGGESVPLNQALGRVLARDVVAPIDVPGFDRANVDGFAVRAEDTFGAEEEKPCRLRIVGEVVTPGRQPRQAIGPGTAMPIATGAMLPRGADAVVMIEHTDAVGDTLLIRRPVAPGANVTFAGTDIGRGETVLRRGTLLTARETGVLAALGLAQVEVRKRPRVAILSTGDELVSPGRSLGPGQIYDCNATILAHAVTELGGEPILFGIVPDDAELLRERLWEALSCDVVLLSGGTSKGSGDVSYRVVSDLGKPGIVVHGVALKPGKPICLAAVGNKPIVVLPGFPTSAIFTFHEFVAPIIRTLAGRSESAQETVQARLPFRINSEKGRTEYVLVNLVELMESPALSRTGQDDRGSAPSVRYAAYPMGKGSGSVTTYSRADGFITIPRLREYLDEGEIVEVRLLGTGLAPADLVVIGSHCVGLDFLLGRLEEREHIRSKMLAVGSQGGLTSARRGECDLAGIHLLDPRTRTYNAPFVGQDLVLVPGYGRLQGIVFRRGDQRFEGKTIAEAVRDALADPECVLVNRNRGSGTRILIDELLGEARPPGYAAEARSHNAVAAAVAQGRADWGVCIWSVARDAGLGFLPLTEERYDFVVPRSRWQRPVVQAFVRLLNDPDIRRDLHEMGFVL